MNNWTHVNDSLPDTTRDVTVTDGMDVSVAYRTNKGQWVGMCDGSVIEDYGYGRIFIDVEYWRECPELPPEIF